MMLEENHEEDWIKGDNEENLYVYHGQQQVLCLFVLLDSFVATISTYAALGEFEEDQFSEVDLAVQPSTENVVLQNLSFQGLENLL